MADDLFDKKKDEAPILDLSKTVISTAEEYRVVLDKVPDYKTRPEKVILHGANKPINFHSFYNTIHLLGKSRRLQNKRQT